MKKIVNIIVFTVAILACILSFVFIGIYNDDKAMYDEVSLVKKSAPEMLTEFLSVTPETLPQFVETYQAKAAEMNDALKVQQMPKDILYTYISNLQDLTAETFADFKADFNHYAEVQFAQTERKQAYIDGFNGVADFDGLAAYITTLQGEYAQLKQAFLNDKDQANAVSGFVGKASIIGETVSKNKQETQIKEMQAAINSTGNAVITLNTVTMLLYVVFFAAILLTIFFAVLQVAKTFKTSYKVLLALLAMILVFVVANLITKSWIDAGIILFYVVFFGALVGVLTTVVISTIKKV